MLKQNADLVGYLSVKKHHTKKKLSLVVLVVVVIVLEYPDPTIFLIYCVTTSFFKTPHWKMLKVVHFLLPPVFTKSEKKCDFIGEIRVYGESGAIDVGNVTYQNTLTCTFIYFALRRDVISQSPVCIHRHTLTHFKYLSNV